MADRQIPNLEEYLGMLENMAFNRDYELDLSEAPNISIRPNGRGSHKADLMPIIYGEYKHDDEAFWFVPRMEFPRVLKDNEWLGNYSSYLESWSDAAKLADYLLKNQWMFDIEE